MLPFVSSVLSSSVATVRVAVPPVPMVTVARPGLSAHREVAALRDGDVDGDGRSRGRGRCERELRVAAFGDARARADAHDGCTLRRRVVVTHCHRGGGGAPDGVAGAA